MSPEVEYRPIPGAPGYKVSEEGVVIGPRGWQLAGTVTSGGVYVNINLHGKRTTKTTAKLADMAWGPPPPPHETYLDKIEAEVDRMLRETHAREEQLLGICRGKGKEKAA